MITKTYILDLTKYEIDEQQGRVVCEAVKEDGVWVGDLQIECDLGGLTRKERSDLEATVKRQFEKDFHSECKLVLVSWHGDKKSPLLRLKKGDKVDLKAGEGEVVYALPESDKIGVRVEDGRVLNFTYKSLEHFLFKKG